MADLKDLHFMQPSINLSIVTEELLHKFAKCFRYFVPNTADGKAAALLIKEKYGIVYRRQVVEEELVEITCQLCIPDDELLTLEASRVV